ncbi:MAG TPA: ATP-binding protein [Clostridia bacterium]|nr:ATP-binding protein [Clostridia bacterium]
MKIAVLSGKGGTGKTTVSASLTAALANCQYIDCDVEEPNGAIFLKPDLQKSSEVRVPVPEADMARCDGCGRCAEVCRFNAIAVVRGRVLVFPEICHHCGACIIACPKNAITETERTIGVVEADGDDTFLQGKLNIGEPISIPIIKALKKRMKKDNTVVLDCSPGASCTVVQSIEGCDYCILVTEPTPFGLHDLRIAVQLVRKLGIAFGIVLNKASDSSRLIHDFCRIENIEILMEIPYSRDIAEAYSRGVLPVHNDSLWIDSFKKLYETIERSICK